MADDLTTPLPTFATGEVVSAAKLNIYRDSLDAIVAALTGDGSVDTAAKHAHKNGLLSARPAASKAGRIYYATDTAEPFMDTGSAWRHMGGPGAYDDFVRAVSATITPSKSGHTWAEASGAWDILNVPALGTAPVNTLGLSGSAPGIATLDTGSLLDRPYEITAYLYVATSADLSIVAKYADASNYVHVQLHSTAINCKKVIGGSEVVVSSSIGFSPSANTAYHFRIQVFGQHVALWVHSGTGFVAWGEWHHDDLDAAGLATATKVGVRAGNLNDRVRSIAVNF